MALFRNQRKSRAKAACWYLADVLEVLLMQIAMALAGLRDVNLHAQISWQAKYFVDLEV